MKNGDSISFSTYWVDYQKGGMFYPQAALSLPKPGDANTYYLFHSLVNYDAVLGVKVTKLLYSVIDMRMDGGLGAVVKKNQVLLNKPTDYGFVTACRHANGRDWWVVVPHRENNVLHRFLLDPSGLHDMGGQVIGTVDLAGLGQACFSPDGRHYARHNAVSHGEGSFLSVYDFDRCTGTFSNPRQWNFNDAAICAGLAYSGNSRFLYVSVFKYLFQLDMEDPSEWNTAPVAIYDGFYDENPLFKTQFYQAQLAPNGKIYLCSPNSTRYLHVVEYPDKKGSTCKVSQHGHRLLTWNAVSVPNIPNFRLGPVDGSACDTLGYNDVLPPVTVDTWEPDEAPGALAIWPNPAGSELFARAPAPVEGRWLLSDFSGRAIRSGHWSGDVQRIDLQGLVPGIYLLSLLDEAGRRMAGKVVVE